MSIKIGRGGLEYTRPSLKSWIGLQELLSKTFEAVEKRGDVADAITFYLSTAIALPVEDLADAPWYDVLPDFFQIMQANTPSKEFPFLNHKMKGKKEVWDYDGRTWYMWAHLFAKAYNWNLDYIASMDVDDAIALAQEIAVEDQLEREWQWMTSEIAYQTKEGFKALPRPGWMNYAPKDMEIKPVQIRKEFMPVGNIFRYESPKSERGA